jgi:hypothetical protein
MLASRRNNHAVGRALYTFHCNITQIFSSPQINWRTEIAQKFGDGSETAYDDENSQREELHGCKLL